MAGIFVLLASLAVVRGQKYRKIPKIKKRWAEAALALVLALDVMSRMQDFSWAHLVSFPLFLTFAYIRFPWKEMLFLFGAHTFVRISGRWVSGEIIQEILLPLLLLFAWTLLALIFRLRESKKHSRVMDRLFLYEREASNLAIRSEEFESLLRHEEKKNAHLAQLIREREASFKNLLEILQKTFEPYTCALYLYDVFEESFLLKEFFTKSDQFAHQQIQASQGIFRTLLHETKPIRMVLSAGEAHLLPYYKGGRVPVRSVIALPLRSDEVLKGAVVLDHENAHAFQEDHVAIIEQVARQLSRAIDNAEVLHAYFHLKEELSNFYAASAALNRSLRLEDVMTTLLDASKKIVQYDLGLVVLFNEQTKANRVVAEAGRDQANWMGREFACAPRRGLISWVIQNQMPLSYVSFRSRKGKTPLFHRRWKMSNIFDSVFVIPMHVKGEPIGAVLFASRKNHFFSKSIKKMLEVIVVQAAVSIKNARMVGDLERLATTDGLTGLMNHRTFQETLSSEVERARRHPAPISLLLVDIDYFKNFNDEYGHPLGDFVLREVGQVLVRTVRKVDVVARYGGEEFAIILVNTSTEGALQMARRIVRAVNQSRFQYQGLSLKIAVSVGSATFPVHAHARNKLIEFADRALYEAKRKGRNRAILYSESLGKMSEDMREASLIRSTEDELRRIVDHGLKAV